ncbi:hypothetical protein C7405_10515 [Paraburkholderia caballeronis]|uniref:hypothetical protein n=1 Tax=Paraburkholderia caballeronis TaxID=416943 RepID=UPI001065B55B|nr:hypothetical protein [Paraburkholderia caballeronis]TDV35527.1 hypothetical protein C7405_10515 [Paraburkholderia caballeronis]
MNLHPGLVTGAEVFDEQWLEQPDGPEITLLVAMRAWLRPRCDAVRGVLDWTTLLRGAGLMRDGIEHFDIVMRSLRTVMPRTLDLRCRCATEMAGDEATLLQGIALLQAGRTDAAFQLLSQRLALPALSSYLKLIRWLAMDLLEAGLPIRVRERAVCYMH